MKKRVIRMIALLGVLAFQQPVLAQEAPSQELVVIDLRPQEEKDGLGLIALSGKCNKDVFRIADVASDPVKVEALRAGLAEQLGLASDGKTLTVLNWSVYYNKQKPSRSFLEGVGVQGYDLPTGKKKETGGAGSKCSKKESAGGWYEGSEVTTIVPPIISEFTGTYGGKPFDVRVVHSVRRKIDGKFKGAADDTEELLATVSETAEALAAAIVK
jgi:hypothetical protein